MIDKIKDYVPNEEEIQKAESMMTADQREASEIRAKNWEQEQPPWEDFETKIDENFNRMVPTPESVERMDNSLRELGEAFEGSSLNWHLDGALNISMMNGAGEDPDKYIGEHKDVDISIEKNELKDVEPQLLKNGYGLFLSRNDDDESKDKILRRVGYEDFMESDSDHLLIAAIDNDGKIRSDKALNFVDVHILERDHEGNAMGASGVKIPEKWVQSYPFDFHGQQINLSHPGKVLYYKLHQSRNYDLTDVTKLIETGAIASSDIDDLEQVYEDEFKANIKLGRKIFEKITNKIDSKTSVDEIYKIMMTIPEFQKQEENVGNLKGLAERIAQKQDRSIDSVMEISIDYFGVNQRNDQKREQILNLRHQVRDLEKERDVRDKISEIV